MKSGFAVVDITGEVVLDPLSARVAVFETGPDRLAFVQLDTLCVRWTATDRIRRRIVDLSL